MEKEKIYQTILKSLPSLIEGCDYVTTNCSNTAALLYDALPDFYLESIEPVEVLLELADDLHTGCPMEQGNKLFDLDWDYKYRHGGQ